MKQSRIERLWKQAAGLACIGLAACGAPVPATRPAPASTGAIPPYPARAGHDHPVIAIIGSNRGTELSDLMLPYGILSRDAALDVQAVAMDDGVLATFTDMGEPGPRLRMPTTVSSFDARFPEGADFVVVPAQASSPALVAWLTQQAGKGATLVSICNGGLIVAQTGLFNGRAATAHWSSEGQRKANYPSIHWTRDRRYIADGPWISTTGVSAAMPASIALIEAIHGRAEAARIAGELGIADWSPRHDTLAYMPHLTGTGWPLAKVVYTNRWLHQRDAIRVPAAEGVDEVSLALTVDAYSSTGRSRAFVSTDGSGAVTTRHGLTLLPDDSPVGKTGAMALLPAEHPATALDGALDGIMQRYGQATADGVALVLEYPRHHSL